jgi:hypothetical protein
MNYKGKVVCCFCGAVFKKNEWREMGVMGCSVNSNPRMHHICKPCAGKNEGMALMKHAVESPMGWFCHSPEEAT